MNSANHSSAVAMQSRHPGASSPFSVGGEILPKQRRVLWNLRPGGTSARAPAFWSAAALRRFPNCGAQVESARGLAHSKTSRCVASVHGEDAHRAGEGETHSKESAPPQLCKRLKLARALHPFLHRPESLVFTLLLAAFNWPVLSGSVCHAMIFLPGAVQAGEWWRLFTHPFVHVSWYHLLLDGAAFLMLYESLADPSMVRRLAYVLAVGAGSLLISWWTAPAISVSGLCGLSGLAHGLMAVSALEMVDSRARHTLQRRLGWATFFLVVGKSALEALTGQAFFAFLHFGLMGDPVAVSHAGGVLGGLLAYLLFHAGPDGS